MQKTIVIILLGIVFTSTHADTEEQFKKEMKKVSVTEIITMDKTKHGGRILVVRDSFLILWEDATPYSINNITRQAKIYNFTDIEKVKIRNPVNALKGCAIGATTGVFSGLYYDDLMYRRDANSCIQIPLEYYLFKYTCMFSGAGLVAGGVLGSIFDRDSYLIRGDYTSFYKISPLLNQNSVFRYYLPAELHNFIQEQKQNK